MMNMDNELFLNAAELNPAVKFATIMKTFNDLKPGQSFILHNDHDPKPLYYQLSATKGDIFTWDYLKQGPDIYEIRIGIKMEADMNGGQSTVTTTPKNEVKQEIKVSKNEKVLDVTQLPPREKHPTIFQYFDNLKEGEGFVIHNDHDPKPLYYQLMAEKGEIFNWDYILEGPDIFEIRISKKILGNEQKETVGSIVAQNYNTAEVFRKYDIDFCCHGNKSLKEASESVGVSEDELRKALETAANNKSALPSEDYNNWEIGFLADYILNTHHRYVRNNAEPIIGLAEKVANVHGGRHPELKELAQITKMMLDDFLIHVGKEESVLFPAIKQMLQMKNNGQKSTVGGGFANAIETMEAEHDETAEALRSMREITKDYLLPADACNSYTYLFEKLKEFEEDTFRHVHLENNILFPKSIVLENEILA
ncbi:MAG: iron-sulfur cluster repair di-iron protein [Chitinophagales bacterium]|nr:iron-sulfur cluster repair di-iron protein [Chitinophagales bacterium]